MYLSRAYIPTQKEIPSDAVIPSHILMLRAGLIRPLASGIYSYLPLGWKLMKKVMEIIREEMDAIGGQELHLPALNPVEIWDETGRNKDFGDELFHLRDRRNHEMVLAPTHEEVVCDLARKYIRSYSDMPQIWYQIQNKFRDEPRPRSGVIRTRQFIMKDSYTLDTDQTGLDHAYDLHAQAYRKIFTRCGLEFHVVGASSGVMGGSGSQEFMVESQDGEDTLVLCENCTYAANLQIAVSTPSTRKSQPDKPLEKVHTPDQRTIDQVSSFLKMDASNFIKSLMYIVDNKPVMLLIRGDHDLNETKLQNYMGALFRPAHPDEVEEVCGAQIGYIGPVHLKKPVRIIADLSLKGQRGLITGANENDYHLVGVELENDISVREFIDLRSVSQGDICNQCGGVLTIVRAIELGHIFKLGIKYSKSMKAFFLDNKGKERPIYMGSYGIGLERILAASIEQNHDDRGIVWNKSLHPYLVHIIPVNMDNPKVVETAKRLYTTLQDASIEVAVDDRNVSPGFKFKDADLIGIPLQLIIGTKWTTNNKIELKDRRTQESNYCFESDLIQTIHTWLMS